MQSLFDGDGDLEGAKKDPRLKKQLVRVYDVMATEKWLPLSEISLLADAPEASASARMRDLRKKKFGGFTIETRMRSDQNVYEYRLDVSSGTPEHVTEPLTDAPEAPTPAPLEEDPRPETLRSVKSLVVLNTGDGRGKSSSAFGIMLRARARDWPVSVVQFLKSPDWVTGEQKMAEPLGVDFWSLGDGFTWDSEDLSKSEAEAREAWRQGKALIESGKYRLIVFDEITYPINWGWIDAEEVRTAIESRPEATSLVLTGRDAPEWLMDISDTVTVMGNHKHAYDSGIAAKKGIDY